MVLTLLFLAAVGLLAAPLLAAVGASAALASDYTLKVAWEEEM